MPKAHCLSLLVHEAPDVIEQQIQNALNYLPNSHIVIHFGLEAALIRANFLAQYENHPRVHINDNCLPTAWGWILHAQLSNYYFAKQIGLDFDFYLMDSSNSLFYRHGLEDYLNNTTANYCLNPVELHSPAMREHWVKLHAFGNDPCFISLVNELRCAAPVYCRHEGTAFRAPLLDEMVKIISKHYEPTLNEIFYPREEVYWATVASHLSKEMADIFAITAEVTPNLIDHLRSENLAGLREFEPWKNSREEYFKSKFSVKPVPRRLDDPLRKHINDIQLIDLPCFHTHQTGAALR